jgi:hypothetical protein
VHGLHRVGRAADAIVEGHLHRLRAEARGDPADQRPEGREDEHLVARARNRTDRGREPARGAGRDQHVLPLAGKPVSSAHLLDDGVHELGYATGLAIAVQPRVTGGAQVLHASAGKGLHPGVADVERADATGHLARALREGGVDGAGHLLGGGGEGGRTRHDDLS